MTEHYTDTLFASGGRGDVSEIDRRRSERTSPDDSSTTAILRDSACPEGRPVRVANESHEGLGICLTEPEHPDIGDTVTVEYQGTARQASVRWVLSKRDHGWRIGLQWREADWTL
jgi:hypothetical protein